jgi:hypothetical protein
VTDVILPHEHGRVRVFQIGGALFDNVPALEQALGATITAPNDVQFVSADMLHEIGLAQFLMLGYGITQTDMAPEMDRLNAIGGDFAIIRSGAFGEAGAVLQTDGAVTLVATFTEEGATPPSLTPLTSDSTQGVITPPETPAKKPKSDARIGGMVATVALILMGLLVWLMIWIGG